MLLPPEQVSETPPASDDGGEGALFTFVRVAGVDPTNNAAERAVRPAVLWRKGSFGTDSANGSRFVERILTVVTIF